MTELAIVTLASMVAGFVDAVVGGGGMVLVPTLFSTYPGLVPATLLGTNKGASVWGTAWATRQYARRVSLNWAILLPAALVALVSSSLGAWAVTLVDARGMRQALPFILAGLLIYTLTKKDLGRTHAPRLAGRAELAAAAAIAAIVGLYDGFFGPGAGSFFVFLFVRVLGYDFLNASASAKLLNLATNAAAVALFAIKGHVWWQVAAVLAVANVAGSWLGTHMALQHGAGFVRVAFIVMVGLLIAKTGHDAFSMP